MITEKLAGMLNEQKSQEVFAEHLYLAMASYCFRKGLLGMAAFFKKQAAEEHTHFMKLYDYVEDHRAEAAILPVKQPDVEFGSTVDVFSKFLSQEQAVTAAYVALYDQAVEDDDYASQQFFDWFVNEQVEEEKTATNWLLRVKLAGDSTPAILLIDHELADLVA